MDDTEDEDTKAFPWLSDEDDWDATVLTASDQERYYFVPSELLANEARQGSGGPPTAAGA
jgi:hypothetical protein